MSITAFDLDCMDQALKQAERGLYTTRPNPAVGCVLVQNQQVVTTGYHQYAGGPHAEIVAIQQAIAQGISLIGSTCYVSLEPCCHYGRTPPCVQALIQVGVKRVVIAVTDPNPRVQGGGISALQEAGIEVVTGIMEEEASLLNQGFLKAMRHHQPFVRLKLAMSLDGRTAVASGESQWITSSESRLDVQRLRARSGAIITGIQTVLIDDPALTVRPETWKPIYSNPIPEPLRVVCDSYFRTPQSAQIMQGLENTWIVGAVESPKKTELEACGATVLTLPDKNSGQVNLGALLNRLYQAEIYDVLIEAGPTLAGAFLQQGLVDELWLYMAPQLLGHEAKPLVNLMGIHILQQALKFKFRLTQHLGPDLKLILMRASDL